MYILHLSDKNTALLLLYYAKQGAAAAKKISLIEAPRIEQIAGELITSIQEK